MGFCASWADGKTISILFFIVLQFGLDKHRQGAVIFCTFVFQSAAVPGRRNSISQPAQSPVR